MKSITVKGKTYDLPIFLPDSTRAVTKSLTSKDLSNVGIKGCVVNTLHLKENPSLAVLDNFGGVKNFMGFIGLVASDSGGWQIYSLIHRDKKPGKITNEGVVFSTGVNKKNYVFTPEESIKTQFSINSDIVVVLDDFTNPKASKKEIKDSVDRTVKWAKMSKQAYDEQVCKRKMDDKTRPLLLSVIQGGWDKDLRAECAQRLIGIGFDGYGFGGYLVNDQTNQLDLPMLKYIADLIPDDKIKFALGTGKPRDIAVMADQGWDIFDCTLPTRDARNKRLYVFNKVPQNYKDLLNKNTYGYVYINRQVFKIDKKPISENCDCLTCKNYSRAYLNHLAKIEDTSYLRLATIHNLRTYTRLIEYIKKFQN